MLAELFLLLVGVHVPFPMAYPAVVGPLERPHRVPQLVEYPIIANHRGFKANPFARDAPDGE